MPTKAMESGFCTILPKFLASLKSCHRWSSRSSVTFHSNTRLQLSTRYLMYQKRNAPFQDLPPRMQPRQLPNLQDTQPAERDRTR